MPTKNSSTSEGSQRKPTPSRHWLARLLMWGLGLAVAGTLSLIFLVATAMAVAYPNLPDISDLSEYQPKLPLRVFTAEGTLIREFGEERRTLTPIDDIPTIMKQAVLAIEDARFYQHGGLDYIGIARAALANLGRIKSQGASTITMQVARNVYLSSEKTYTRKIYEILLTLKLEHLLSKDQILEIYMNQIYLGNRAYGFAAASETYFGKPLQKISIAEAAMLAGLPKAPSAYNPINNFKRAKIRQMHIIGRMLDNGFITPQQAAQAKKEQLKIMQASSDSTVHGEYVAETVRQLMYSQYGAQTYTRGLNVYTTLRAADQAVAYQALRRGIMNYERRQHYRGPEKFISLPSDPQQMEDVIDEALLEHPDNGDVLSAVVLQASSNKVKAVRQNGETIEITGDGLQPAMSGLSPSAATNVRIRRGAVIRVMQTGKNSYDITQLPEVEGAFVAMDPRDGSIKALVGGFDFDKNKFNHVTQAWRQPGSSFKPFIYSAAIERGLMPTTLVNDAPMFFDAGVTGGQPWEPKNYEGTFDGPMTVRKGLAESKNMISIRVLQMVGPQNAQQWATRFGFDAERHPAYLTMALGVGSATPLQIASGYSVFANGGYRVNPWLISKVTDAKGKVLAQTNVPVLDESVRAVDARNAFMMDNLLNEVTRSGTAARAQATLKRPDLYGKTGTTNDSLDAWFAGFQPSLTAVTWIGYDNPRKLGRRETGGGLALPVWMEFMQHALKSVPIMEIPVPPGVVNIGGEWYYNEFTPGKGIASLGVTAGDDASRPQVIPMPAADERRRILDLFRN
jgi:penicillin-binding protein 1A